MHERDSVIKSTKNMSTNGVSGVELHHIGKLVVTVRRSRYVLLRVGFSIHLACLEVRVVYGEVVRVVKVQYIGALVVTVQRSAIVLLRVGFSINLACLVVGGIDGGAVCS